MGDERSTQIGVRVGILRADAHGLAERCNRFLVVVGLSQYQPDIVVGFRKIRPQAEPLRETPPSPRSCPRPCVRGEAPTCCAHRPAPVAWPAPGEVRRWRYPNRVREARGSEHSARPRIVPWPCRARRHEDNDAEIDVGSRGVGEAARLPVAGSPAHRSGHLCPAGRFRETHSWHRRRIEPDALLQFGKRFLLRTAVPLRDSQVVVSFRPIRAGARPHAPDELAPQADRLAARERSPAGCGVGVDVVRAKGFG